MTSSLTSRGVEPYHSLPSTASLPERSSPAPAMMMREGSFQSLAATDSRFTINSTTRLRSIESKFSLSPDIGTWGLDDLEEADDDFHGPPRQASESTKIYHDGHIFSSRGLANLGCLIFLCIGIIVLFAGYPMIVYFTKTQLTNEDGYNIGGINATGQIPNIGNFGLIDQDTPQSAYTLPSWKDGSEMVLVFSDEFEQDGRTFYPGDDPYWEAVDLHYWATDDMEWYDPSAITTANGSLVITMEQKETHNLNFQSGMMSTWNKFCFTGGYIAASVQLPGVNDVVGLWPAVWTMGNLGRAGYGATLDGMWPYSYDSCDVGTVINQTVNGQPAAAATGGKDDSALSYLPGQRLSRCTCNGESHPGPKHSDGTFVGRSAPEIDVFEAQIQGDPLTGQVSQSAQWAPFNHGYIWENTTQNLIIANPSISSLNTYIGSETQQATSVVTNTNPECYEQDQGCYSVYGFEYKPGFDDAYISWISSNQLAWTLQAAGMGADSIVEISARPIPQEPMYLLVNLGMSTSFGTVDLEHLPFPVRMRIDWIRVYQPINSQNYGCDPDDFPTETYINQYIEAYTNPNLTTWVDDFGQKIPRNSYLGQC